MKIASIRKIILMKGRKWIMQWSKEISPLEMKCFMNNSS